MNHMNMNGMNVGNGAGGPMPQMNNGTNGATLRTGNDQEPQVDYKIRLHTYIYDYFLKHEQYDCARQLLKSSLTLNTRNNHSPARRPNGIDDNSMETDSKDDIDPKRPHDLPLPELNDANDNTSFLLEWFSLFWDMFFAHRKLKPASAQALQYMQHTQQASRMRQEQQSQYLRQPVMMPGNLGYPNMRIQANGMPMNQNELRARASQNNLRNLNPQLMARSQQQYLQQQQQQQMERGGSDVDINGQRPRTPSSGDNAPSPSKKPRLEGPPFPGQQMIPNGRPPPQGMQGHVMMDPNITQAQLDKFNAQTIPNQQKSIAVYTQSMAQAHRQNMPPGAMMNQGSPMMQGGMEMGVTGINDYYNTNPQGMRMGPQAGVNGANHALHDYQVQLMLLEQQNKKRLMMARQEAEHRPDGQPMPGQAGFPTGMSPQGSRSGPSPNPSEQMKRGTPKMGLAGLPTSGSPMPDGGMPPGRASPAPMNLSGQMPPEMFQQAMKTMGEGMVMGPNGIMRPPQSSHPQFPNGPLNAQQMEMMRAQAAQNGGRMPNGVNWQQGPQGQAPMMPQTSQPQQPVGTPQQRSAMPPPQAVPAAGAANGRPSPPSQAANPPTPQQSAKANPKAKKDTKDRKKPQKKGSTTTATPSAEAENQPPISTPSTPITPMHHRSFNDPKNNANGPMPGSNNPPAATSAPVAASAAQPPPDNNIIQQYNPNMDGIDPEMNLDFTMEGDGVMDNIDFDSFLQDQNVDPEFGFDASIAFTNFDSVEAGAGDA